MKRGRPEGTQKVGETSHECSYWLVRGKWPQGDGTLGTNHERKNPAGVDYMIFYVTPYLRLPFQVQWLFYVYYPF
jgi:hypothetical protein